MGEDILETMFFTFFGYACYSSLAWHQHAHEQYSQIGRGVLLMTLRPRDFSECSSQEVAVCYRQLSKTQGNAEAEDAVARYDPSHQFVVTVRLVQHFSRASCVHRNVVRSLILDKAVQTGMVGTDTPRPHQVAINGPSPTLVCRQCTLTLSSKEKHKCASCRMVYYCNRRCQRLDWKRHQEDCKRLEGEYRQFACWHE